MKIRNEIMGGRYEFLNENGLSKIDGGILRGSGGEGRSELLDRKYFDEDGLL
ncbi:hypothetical protein [Staphylococcus epidermidis]|uniref:hypothetical protein n=1 Tax=Staphylococcus epidermidis TaxID=1282 RepID=UPI001643107E|nr:hypothetical protein [Staphylococcus epidermidis]